MKEIPHEISSVADTADLLYSQAAVNKALDRIASEIEERLSDANPLLLCVMNGGVITTAALMERLDFPLRLDHVHASRYRGDTSGHEIEWRTYPETDLKDQTVLIIDDILDEGVTLAAILDHCRKQGAREVFVAVLVNKQHNRKAPGIRADFCGLEVEDRYVFGYGMDYRGYLRNAMGIYAVKESS
ncbi:MAG: hypoxanthine-guanine phosphoribosyltransferase [Gammaproteobacteria bacterium]|nr:MAG: hypoxanthine-guanine phosphoribosyltransferase [Gammaproteobacteria bacterium]